MGLSRSKEASAPSRSVDHTSQPGRTAREGVPGGAHARRVAQLTVITDPASVQGNGAEDIGVKGYSPHLRPCDNRRTAQSRSEAVVAQRH